MEELIGAMIAAAAIKGIALPSAPADIARSALEVDSLVVVSILCAVEPILGFELPESVVRTGGYSSVRSAVDHLVPHIEAQWATKKGSGR
jgi:acyl carrier protein